MLATRVSIVSVLPVPGGPSITDIRWVRPFLRASRWLRFVENGKMSSPGSAEASGAAPRRYRSRTLPCGTVLNLYDVLRHPSLILTKDAVQALQTRFQKA